MKKVEPLLAAAAAALSVWAASLLPAEVFLSREGQGFFFSDRKKVPVHPASGQIDPDKGTTLESSIPWKSRGREEDAFIAAGHFTNEAQLEMEELVSIYEGVIDKWDELRQQMSRPINLYTADPKGLEDAGLPAGKAGMLATWDEVVTRLESEPGAMALLPVRKVRPSVRVLSRPMLPDGRPARELPVRTIAIAGDVMLGNWIQIMGRAKWMVAGEQGYPFSYTSPLLRAADLAVVNLECVASEGPRAGGIFGIQFRAGEASLDLVREAGIDLVSLANNHTYDYGEKAFVEMISNLDVRGIRHAGAGVTAEQAYAPKIFTLGQTRVAFIAITDIPPNRPAPMPSGLIVASTYPVMTSSRRRLRGASAPSGAAHPDRSLSRWEEAIKIARTDSDIVIILIHWGEEFMSGQNERQRSLARKMIDLGADLVVGAHTHCVQGIEWVRGRAVIYSLGNFVFALNEIPGRVGSVSDGVLLQCRILDRRLYQFDNIPVLEVLGSPVPAPLGCSDPTLTSYRQRTMERIYNNSFDFRWALR